VEELEVDVRGLRLRICAWGPPDGPVVMCLHGLLDQGATWSRVAERLAAAGRRVLAPDARGHGHSDHVGAGGYYHFPDYVADLDAIVRHLALEDLTLVGHSMGGTVSCWYAATRPEALSRLVIVEGLGPPALPESLAAERMQLFLKGLESPPRHKDFDSLEQAVERMVRLTPALDRTWAHSLARRVLVPHEGRLRWTWDPLHRTRSPATFPTERFLGVLERIDVPTTLVSGERSWYRLEDLPAREAAVRPVARHVLPSGHALTIEVPDEVARIILEAPP